MKIRTDIPKSTVPVFGFIFRIKRPLSSEIIPRIAVVKKLKKLLESLFCKRKTDRITTIVESISTHIHAMRLNSGFFFQISLIFLMVPSGHTVEYTIENYTVKMV